MEKEVRNVLQIYGVKILSKAKDWALEMASICLVSPSGYVHVISGLSIPSQYSKIVTEFLFFLKTLTGQTDRSKYLIEYVIKSLEE